MHLAPAASVGLTTDQIDHYHESGYLVLREVLSTDEIAALASEAQTLWDRKDLIDSNNIRCRWQDHVDTGECLFDCFDPVIDVGPVCRRIARHQRIMQPLSQLYGEPAYLFKDKLIFKQSGAKGYALHQDYIAWREFPRSFITVVVAIDSTHADNGATEVFPGYHRRGYLSADDGDYHELPLGTVDESTGVFLDLAPGDIGLFGAFTPHRSAPNRSGTSRRQLYVSYSAASDGGDLREAHYKQFHGWLRTKYAQFDRHDVYFH